MTKQTLSVASLLTRLINSPTPPINVPEEGDKKGTTVRLEPRVRAWVDAESEKLGISTQEFIAMLLKAVMTNTVAPKLSELDMLRERFFEIFTAHGIAAADIHSLVPGLARADLLDTATLINKLDDNALGAVADLFLVELDWLKGVGAFPYGHSAHRWYKQPEAFAARLAYLRWHSRHVRVNFCIQAGTTYEDLRDASERGDELEPLQVCVVIECERRIGRLAFRVYDVWEAQRWNYWRCRHFLKVLMLICRDAGVSYDGVEVQPTEFGALCRGGILAAQAFHYRTVWYPDQLFWTDERNLERREIKDVKALYKEHLPNLAPAMRALQQPLAVTNWDTCLRVGFLFEKPSEKMNQPGSGSDMECTYDKEKAQRILAENRVLIVESKTHTGKTAWALDTFGRPAFLFHEDDAIKAERVPHRLDLSGCVAGDTYVIDEVSYVEPDSLRAAFDLTRTAKIAMVFLVQDRQYLLETIPDLHDLAPHVLLTPTRAAG